MTELRILIVDDDEDLAIGIADVLEIEGHRALVAFSGEAALTMARSNSVDLAFVDVKLPGISGIDVLCELRRQHPVLPIALMTGFRIDQLLAHTIGPGLAQVLPAPATCAEVQRQLTRAGSKDAFLLAANEAPDFPRTLVQELSGDGYRVSLATTAADALDGVTGEAGGVQLLDLHLPLVRGLEVVLELRRRGRSGPVVMITDQRMDEGNSKGPLRSLELTGCLFKPFDLDALVKVAQRLRAPAGETGTRHIGR